MTYKQHLRQLFANLWYLCACLARDKIHSCGFHNSEHATEHAKWWEEFLVRCEKRALHHGEFVPGKDYGSNGDSSNG